MHAYGGVSKKAAKAWFLKNAPGEYGSTNLWRTIQKWGLQFEAHGSVFDSIRSGRPPAISDEHALELADLLVEGFKVTVERLRVWRGFGSLKDAAKHNARVQEILSMYTPGLDMKTVQQRINHLAPWLPACKKKVDFKTELDPATKAEREEVAAKLQRLTLKQLQGVVFIDAKSVKVKVPKSTKVYDNARQRVVEDARLPKGKFHTGLTLYYYAAVNALVGVVLFAWVTGTTGKSRTYKTQVRRPPSTPLLHSQSATLLCCLLHAHRVPRAVH
jgi:hypothetical protein